MLATSSTRTVGTDMSEVRKAFEGVLARQAFEQKLATGSKDKSDALAHTEAVSAKKRLAEADKILADLSKLKPQVDNASSSAEKKFDRAYDKLFDVGAGSAKAAEKLLKQYGDLDRKSLPGDGNAIDALKQHLAGWKSNVANHNKHKDSWAHEKFQQAQQTSGAMYNLDRSISHLPYALTE